MFETADSCRTIPLVKDIRMLVERVNFQKNHALSYGAHPTPMSVAFFKQRQKKHTSDLSGWRHL